MKFGKIGTLKVSRAGLGCNNFGMRIGREEAHAVIDAAFDAGVRLFDTADVYGPSEEWLGEVLASRRKEVIIATKFGYATSRGGTRKSMMKSVETSLRHLRSDYIDLCYLHRPDDSTPIDETLLAFDELLRAGKVREIGCSNFSAAQMRTAAQRAQALGVRSFAAIENNYNLLFREPQEEVLPACRALGVAFVPFFPLASGLLTGKYTPGASLPADSRVSWMLRDQLMKSNHATDAEVAAYAAASGQDPLQLATEWGSMHGKIQVNVSEALRRLESIAARSGKSMLELALGWLHTQPEVATVIAGATRPEQVRANVAATLCELDPEVMSALATLLDGLTG
jgi:aryl-alcohol dehydrogenase-like predicted oxidoreductase